jgi:hypothetical protein
MMVRVALLVGIALTLVMQVFANSGVAVNGRVFHGHFFSNRLTISSELTNSTNTASHNEPTIDYFLRPDSEVDSTLQASLQKFKELKTAPFCNKRASLALKESCETLKGGNEAQESMEDILAEEKTLFAARFAVCELSDSTDRSLVPAECASFVLAKQKGWLDFGSAKGRQESFPRYPEYDQATRQNRDRCVGALQNNPLTVISYSNAKQIAHQWCSIARFDIEKDELLQTHRALTENLVHQNDVVHSLTEALGQHMKAMQLLNNQLRIFAQDLMETNDALREVLVDARETVHSMVQDMGVQFQAHLDDSMVAHDAHDARLRAKVDNIVSEILNVTAQHSTDLALARRNDAEELGGRLSYAVELIEQRIIQLSSDADSTSREVAIRGSETLEILELVRLQLAGSTEVINNITSGMQQLQDQQDALSAKLENSGKVATTLESRLLAISDTISTFTKIPDCVLAAAWYCLYVIGAVTILLFLWLGGWRILTLATVSILKLLKITVKTLKELAQTVLHVASNILASVMNAAQRCVDWKGALLLISSVAGIAFYSLAVETPTAYWQRLENGDLSLFEPVNCVAIGLILVGLLCAISKPALAIRESGLLQSGEYEHYDDKECAV